MNNSFPVIGKGREPVRGMKWVSTPGHGHMTISATLLSKMPKSLLKHTTFYKGGCAFEKDLEFYRVVLAFPDLFEQSSVINAHDMISKYHPDIYAAWREEMGFPKEVDDGHAD